MEVFNVTEVQLPMVSFMDRAFGIASTNSLPYLRSSRFCFILFFRSFVVSYYTFKSMIHFANIFSQPWIFFFFNTDNSIQNSLFCTMFYSVGLEFMPQCIRAGCMPFKS